MRYIDKRANEEEGNLITDGYLENECKTADQLTGEVRYQNIDYAGSFSTGGYKKQMLELGMVSQQRYCCYCLRKIGKSKSATLEHIIPQKSASTQGYDRFTELYNRQVMLTSEFTYAENQTRPPYPHTVAWNNLVVSCDGRFPIDNQVSSHCCNNARSSEYAPPVYYLPDLESRLVYMQDGTLQPLVGNRQDEIRATIGSAKLNCQALKEIRRLWYLLRNCPYKEIVSCLYDRNLRMKTLYSVLPMKDSTEVNMVFKYLKDEYWRTFMEYHLFYKIFQEKN